MICYYNNMQYYNIILQYKEAHKLNIFFRPGELYDCDCQAQAGDCGIIKIKLIKLIKL